jgi:hypothetical protein
MRACERKDQAGGVYHSVYQSPCREKLGALRRVAMTERGARWALAIFAVASERRGTRHRAADPRHRCTLCRRGCSAGRWLSAPCAANASQ